MNKLKPLEMSRDSVAQHLLAFEREDTYAIIHGLWHREREELLEKGKADPKEGYLHELRGFDRAASLIRRWASKVENKEGAETPNPVEEE